jgi:hypothetical protein
MNQPDTYCSLRAIKYPCAHIASCVGHQLRRTGSRMHDGPLLIRSEARLAWRACVRCSLVALRRRLSPGLPLSRMSEGRMIAVENASTQRRVLARRVTPFCEKQRKFVALVTNEYGQTSNSAKTQSRDDDFLHSRCARRGARRCAASMGGSEARCEERMKFAGGERASRGCAAGMIHDSRKNS